MEPSDDSAVLEEVCEESKSKTNKSNSHCDDESVSRERHKKKKDRKDRSLPIDGDDAAASLCSEDVGAGRKEKKKKKEKKDSRSLAIDEDDAAVSLCSEDDGAGRKEKKKKKDKKDRSLPIDEDDAAASLCSEDDGAGRKEKKKKKDKDKKDRSLPIDGDDAAASLCSEDVGVGRKEKKKKKEKKARRDSEGRDASLCSEDIGVDRKDKKEKKARRDSEDNASCDAGTDRKEKKDRRERDAPSEDAADAMLLALGSDNMATYDDAIVPDKPEDTRSSRAKSHAGTTDRDPAPSAHRGSSRTARENVQTEDSSRIQSRRSAASRSNAPSRASRAKPDANEVTNENLSQARGSSARGISQTELSHLPASGDKTPDEVIAGDQKTPLESTLGSEVLESAKVAPLSAISAGGWASEASYDLRSSKPKKKSQKAPKHNTNRKSHVSWLYQDDSGSESDDGPARYADDTQVTSFDIGSQESPKGKSTVQWDTEEKVLDLEKKPRKQKNIGRMMKGFVGSAIWGKKKKKDADIDANSEENESAPSSEYSEEGAKPTEKSPSPAASDSSHGQSPSSPPQPEGKKKGWFKGKKHGKHDERKEKEAKDMRGSSVVGHVQNARLTKKLGDWWTKKEPSKKRHDTQWSECDEGDGYHAKCFKCHQPVALDPDVMEEHSAICTGNSRLESSGNVDEVQLSMINFIACANESETGEDLFQIWLKEKHCGEMDDEEFSAKHAEMEKYYKDVFLNLHATPMNT